MHDPTPLSEKLLRSALATVAAFFLLCLIAALYLAIYLFLGTAAVVLLATAQAGISVTTQAADWCARKYPHE